MTVKQSIKNENVAEKKLPIGISSIPKILEKNLIYVDKTEYVYRLLKVGGIYFLSRPQRFGKYLLISILKEIFNGKKELFKVYWIYDRIEWEKYPVIHLDFLDIDYRTLGLEEVQSSFFHFLLEKYSDKSSGDIEKILPGIKKALKEEDIDSFVETIRVLFSGIPYNISLSRYEAYYHSLISSTWLLLPGKKSVLLNEDEQGNCAIRNNKLQVII